MTLCTLISIAPSHYCEKARWALERAGIAYKEHNFVPIFHSLKMRSVGGGSTPTLVTGDIVLRDSTDILVWTDAYAAENAKLYPRDPDARRAVEEWEELFDTALGSSTRSIAYFYVLDAPALFFALNDVRLGAVQRFFFQLLQRPLRFAIKKGLRIDAKAKDQAHSKLEHVLERVEREIADGRRYLVADSFSAADLTFAALLSPLLASERLLARRGLTSLDHLYPQGFSDTIAATRSRPAGIFALRTIDTERQ